MVYYYNSDNSVDSSSPTSRKVVVQHCVKYNAGSLDEITFSFVKNRH